MTLSRKDRIARAFDRAEDYDGEAEIQRIVATRLAERVLALNLDPSLPALEIGCGTGFLTEALLAARRDLALTISDIAPAMLDRARARIGERPNLRYALIDGEAPALPAARFGLIVSSLAFQWFEHPLQSIERLIPALTPGGRLAFSTLGAGSFREWTDAQQQAGLVGLTRDYPHADLFSGIASEACEVDVNGYSLEQKHADGKSFLRSLRAIGAHARWRDDAPAPTGRLRHAITLFEQKGATISYEITEVVIRRVK
ncbi:MAG: methyltransferase [Sphingomonadaceae bacterium]